MIKTLTLYFVFTLSLNNLVKYETDYSDDLIVDFINQNLEN